jgi:ankyrin repeat protein
MSTTADAADRVAAAVEARDEAKVRELLAADPAVAATRDSRGRSLLLLALFHALPGAAAALLEACGEERLDPLEAAATGRVDRLGELLEADRIAVLAARTPEGFDAIGLAAFLGGAETVTMLVRNGADPEGDPRNQLGVRPVHAAAAARDAVTMRRLLEAGADPDTPQRGGIVPLHAAAQQDDVDTVTVLLDHGADPCRRADDGRDPIAFAEAAGAGRALALLRAVV